MIHWLCGAMSEMPVNDQGVSPSLSFLGAAERQTYRRFKIEKRRQEWLLGRWTAKRLLRQRRPETPLAEIEIGNEPGGAPYYAISGQRLPLSLSISHRSQWAFCALSAAHTIGADIEQIEPRNPAFVHDFFTAAENALVWSCPESLRDTLITLIWSAKESALKALREGLRIDTRRIEVIDLEGLHDAPAPDDWHSLQIRCIWPAAPRFAAWWKPDGHNNILTLAAGAIEIPRYNPH